MVVVGDVLTMALAMAAVGGLLVLPVFKDAPDCSGTTVVFAMVPLDVMFPFVFRLDFVILYNVEAVASVDFCCCVLFVVAFDDVVAG